MPTAYELIKLGMNLQHLRSTASTSIFLGTSLVEFANLEENQPAVRCSVRKTVELLTAIRAQLQAFGFARSIEALAPLAPMQAEMEEALQHAPPGDDLILRDPFADKLVEHVKQLMVVVKEEGSAIELSPRGDAAS
jgi:hypothetical protein